MIILNYYILIGILIIDEIRILSLGKGLIL